MGGTPFVVGPSYDVSSIYVYHNKEDEACRAFTRLDTGDHDSLVTVAESGGVEAHRRTINLAQQARCAGLVFARNLAEAQGLRRGLSDAMIGRKSADMGDALDPYANGILLVLGLACTGLGALYFGNQTLKRAFFLFAGTAGMGIGGFRLLLSLDSTASR